LPGLTKLNGVEKALLQQMAVRIKRKIIKSYKNNNFLRIRLKEVIQCQ